MMPGYGEDMWTDELLLGNTTQFTHHEVEKRKAYIANVRHGIIPAPQDDWLEHNAANELANCLYNSLFDLKFQRETGHASAVDGFDTCIMSGGDSELWTVIRAALDEVCVSIVAGWFGERLSSISRPPAFDR